MSEHKVEEVKLKNGARGLLIDIPNATVMNFHFHFRAGSCYVKDKEIYETAHLMEHMAFGSNSKYRSEADFQAEFEKNGAINDAYTSDQSMLYVTECADFEWDRILDMQELTICHPRFIEEELESEKGNVRSELTGYLNERNRLVWTRIRQMTMPSFLSLRQRLQTINNIKVTDIRAHHKRTHTSDNMRFVIAGNLMGRKNEIKRKLEEWPLKRGERFKAPDADIYSFSSPALIRRKESANLSFGFSFFIPRSLDQKETDAMGILNHILTGTLHSGILGEARKKGLAYVMGSECYVNHDNTSWDFGGDVNKEYMDALFDIVVKKIQDVADGKLSEKHLEAAKNYALGRHQMGAQTVGQISDFYNTAYFSEDKILDYKNVPKRIAGVDVDTIKRIVREFIKENRIAFAGVMNGERRELDSIYAKFSKLNVK